MQWLRFLHDGPLHVVVHEAGLAGEPARSEVPLPGVPRITPAELGAELGADPEAGPLVVDLRSSAAYRAAHLPGSVHARREQLADLVAPAAAAGRRVVLVGDGSPAPADAARDLQAATLDVYRPHFAAGDLLAAGIDVRVLDGDPHDVPLALTDEDPVHAGEIADQTGPPPFGPERDAWYRAYFDWEYSLVPGRPGRPGPRLRKDAAMTTTLQGLQGLHEHPVGLRTGPVRTVTTNYTERGRAGRTGRTSTSGGRPLPQLALRGLVPLLLLVVWQLSDTLEWVDARTLPSPLAILEAYRELWAAGDLQAALPISLQRAGIGLAVGGGTGLLLGVLAGLSVTAERAYDAPLQMLRTIPFIALVPLFVVWFGIGETSKIALIIGASIFPVYLNTYHAIRGIDPKLLEVGRTFGMWPGPDDPPGRRSRSAMPGILVGWRYAAGVALLGLVAAEQINSQAGHRLHPQHRQPVPAHRHHPRRDPRLRRARTGRRPGDACPGARPAPWRPQHDSQ